MKISFVEEDIQTYDVINADEAWIPSTPYCLGPVVRFNGEPIGEGTPSPVWRRILDRWSEIAGKDIYREMVPCDSEQPSPNVNQLGQIFQRRKLHFQGFLASR